MTRIKALLRLHQHLLASRERLGKKLTGELAYVHDGNTAEATGDSADLAFEASRDEMSYRLAELDDRELNQIERALTRWNQGMYGICEGGSWNCQKKIPLSRLNALPYAPFCINCEREMDKFPNGQARQSQGSWAQIDHPQARIQDQQVNLSKLEKDSSGSPRGGWPLA